MTGEMFRVLPVYVFFSCLDVGTGPAKLQDSSEVIGWLMRGWLNGWD